MATLVFDIETSALGLENFDAVQLEYLFREADQLPDQAARAIRREEIQGLFSLWPLTGQVVCVAMLNPDSGKGQVLFTAEDCETAEEEESLVQFQPCADEAEMLGLFWAAALKYKSVVTFNGRGFDVPFLYLRSALLNVPITRKDWLGYRFQTEPHCDLADQFAFYSGTREGAARRFNLDFYCKAFGVPTPKDQGVTGMDVKRLVAEGRYREIAEYCLRDVHATAQLYRIWKERLAGIK